MWKLLGTIFFPHTIPVDSQRQKHTKKEFYVYMQITDCMEKTMCFYSCII